MIMMYDSSISQADFAALDFKNRLLYQLANTADIIYADGEMCITVQNVIKMVKQCSAPESDINS